tara:strand:- start:12416 stop:14242 length:1827 start_codon:yes stop_codon:yes gene_type:complete
MCGIVGYVGKGNSAGDIIHGGLKSLEYRGYDSCGIALANKGWDQLRLFKTIGPPSDLEIIKYSSSCGIGHTRWATHGEVNTENTHPHHCQDNEVYLVHNGVVENSDEIKEILSRDNYKFYGDTDSEVLANLISFYHKTTKNPLDSIKSALAQVEGTFGLAILFRTELGEVLYGARRSSPLVLGVNDGEYFLASDTSAIPPHVDKIIYLEDDQITKITREEFKVYNIDTEKEVCNFNLSKRIKPRKQKAKLGEYSTFLEKEIFEQADCIRDSTRGRFSKDYSSVVFGGIDTNKEIKRVVFLGCGTAYHAGLLGKYYMENIAGIPASVEISSEYRYKNNPTEDGTLVVAISQSGETIDTLFAVREAQDKGVDTIAITNTVMSSIARQVEEGIYQRVGQEVSVASTKAFTSQVTLILMLAVLLGRKNKLSAIESKEYIKQIRYLPKLVGDTLELCKESIKKTAVASSLTPSCTFLGRQYMYPIAIEGALKLKELCYISTHGYPTGELKHGPIAHMCPMYFFIAPEQGLRDKNITAMKEIKSRKGRIILVKQRGQKIPEDCYDYLIEIPKAKDYILPILAAVPIQLFALYLAEIKGYNVDKPRHLAKSVTVE